MKKLRIHIIGAGAMGGVFAALLSSQAQVTVLDTWSEHVQAIREHGLKVSLLGKGEKHAMSPTLYHFAAYSDFSTLKEEAGKADVVLIFTKSQATGQAAQMALEVLTEQGVIITLQNGLGNLDVITRVTGSACVTAGVTSQAGTMIAPGHVCHAGTGPTSIGILPSRQETLHRVAACFEQAGIPCTLSGDLDTLIWGKLIVNVGINALCALLHIPNGILPQLPAAEQIMAEAVQEAVQVAEKKGISLPYTDAAAALTVVKDVCAATAANRASMLQDILHARPTEVDVINGAIVRQGTETGVSVPVNTILSQLIRAMEESAAYRLR